MKTLLMTTIAALSLAVPVFAADGDLDLTATGDVEKGEKAFRKCISCHVVQNEEGETLAGNKAKTGPNLYCIVGHQAGTVEDFKFGDDVIAAGEAGMIFDEPTFVAYVQDPTEALREATGDKKARSKMTFKIRKEDEAKDLYAYVKSLCPETE